MLFKPTESNDSNKLFCMARDTHASVGVVVFVGFFYIYISRTTEAILTKFGT